VRATAIALAIVFVLSAVATQPAQAQANAVIYQLAGADAAYPQAGVTMGRAGYLYGTAGDGTVSKDSDTPRYPSTDLPRAEDAGAMHSLAVPHVEPPHPDNRVRWKSANQQALLSTGIMHTFNLWTEAGRETP